MDILSYDARSLTEELFGPDSGIPIIRCPGERDLETYVKKVKEWQAYMGWNPREPTLPLPEELLKELRAGLEGETKTPNSRLFKTRHSKVELEFGFPGFFEYRGSRVYLKCATHKPDEISKIQWVKPWWFVHVVTISPEALRNDEERKKLIERIVKLLKFKHEIKKEQKKKAEFDPKPPPPIIVNGALDKEDRRYLRKVARELQPV